MQKFLLEILFEIYFEIYNESFSQNKRESYNSITSSQNDNEAEMCESLICELLVNKEILKIIKAFEQKSKNAARNSISTEKSEKGKKEKGTICYAIDKLAIRRRKSNLIKLSQFESETNDLLYWINRKYQITEADVSLTVFFLTKILIHAKKIETEHGETSLSIFLLKTAKQLCKDAKVLDCFTHTGSFALNAGIAGAGSVIGVDASQLAVDQATENARLNGLEDRVKFICRDVFELLPELEKQGEKFDVVILDPPAFTKSRNSIKNAVKGYREINLRAMKLVKDGGFLATCSCSHFMSYELFTQTIGQAARNVHKRLRQVEYRTQAPDHPILWAADESYYLKFYIFQVCEER